MDRLSSLPTEIIHLIIERLEYASEVNSLSQTCHRLSKIATHPHLYPKYSRLCSPISFHRLVESGNGGAMRRLVSDGAQIPRRTYCHRYHKAENSQRSLMAAAASKGFVDVMQVLRDVLGPNSARPSDLYCAIEKGDVSILKQCIHTNLPPDTKEHLLLYAARNGCLNSVKFMVDEGFDINLTTDAKTPIMEAANCARLDIIEYLLETGADPNLTSELESHNGITPLHYAASADASRNPELVVRCLLNHGARLAGPGESETQGLADLVSRGADDMAKIIMDQCDFEERLSSATVEERGDLLFIVAAFGDEILTRRILDMECPPIEHQRFRAVSEAAKRGRCGIVKLLLHKMPRKRTAAIDAIYQDALTKAMESNEIPTLNAILEHGGNEILGTFRASLFLNRLVLKNESISSILGDRGMLDYVNEYNFGAVIQTVIEVGNSELVVQLMQRLNIDPFWLFPRTQRSIFDTVAQLGPIESFQKLLSMGVSLNPDDERCRSALFHAAKGFQNAIIQLFLDNGFSVNSIHSMPMLIQRNFMQPLIVHIAKATLHSSVKKNNALSTMRLLLDQGADVDAANTEGDTALAVASRKNFEVAKELLIRGANPFRQCKDGTTPLHIAIENHQYHLVKEFLSVAPARGFEHGDFPSLMPSMMIQRLVSLSFLELQAAYAERYPDEDFPRHGSITDWHQHQSKVDNNSLNPCYWTKFLIAKELKKYYWRRVYPVPSDAQY